MTKKLRDKKIGQRIKNRYWTKAFNLNTFPYSNYINTSVQIHMTKNIENAYWITKLNELYASTVIWSFLKAHCNIIPHL